MPRDDDEKVFEDLLPWFRLRFLAHETAMLLQTGSISIRCNVSVPIRIELPKLCRTPISWIAL